MEHGTDAQYQDGDNYYNERWISAKGGGRGDTCLGEGATRTREKQTAAAILKRFLARYPILSTKCMDSKPVFRKRGNRECLVCRAWLLSVSEL